MGDRKPYRLIPEKAVMTRWNAANGNIQDAIRDDHQPMNLGR
jgi:hypothetical protein